MPCIKIGLDEWVIVDRSMYYNFSLWTDNLKGGVAVAIVTKTHAFLTHISHQVSTRQWENEVSKKFLTALDNLGSLPRDAMCEITLADDNETKLSWAVYRTVYIKWKESEAATESEPKISWQCTGIRIHIPSLSKFEAIKDIKYKPEWGENKNSKSGSKYIKHKGFLTKNGALADL